MPRLRLGMWLGMWLVEGLGLEGGGAGEYLLVVEGVELLGLLLLLFCCCCC